MTTYAMHLPACFLIDPHTAAAVNLAWTVRNSPGDIPAGLAKDVREHGPWPAVEAGLVPQDLLEELTDVQLAMESLEGTVDCVFAAGFDGSAASLETDDKGEPALEWHYEDDFVAAIDSDNPVTPFTAAYSNLDELAGEFRRKLEPVLGPDYPYASRVVSLTGTYYC